MKTNNGFTLLEALVSIVVLAIWSGDTLANYISSQALVQAKSVHEITYTFSLTFWLSFYPSSWLNLRFHSLLRTLRFALMTDKNST